MWLLSSVFIAAILLSSPISAIPAKRYDIVLVVEGSSIIPVPITSTAPSADIANIPFSYTPQPQPAAATAAILTNQAGGPFKTLTSTPGLYPDPTNDPVVFSTSKSSPDPTNIPGVFTVGTLVVTPFLSPLQTDAPLSSRWSTVFFQRANVKIEAASCMHLKVEARIGVGRTGSSSCRPEKHLWVQK